jgi:ribonuclease I
MLQFKKALRIAKTSFIMVFIAHLLGCLFTMLIDVESGRNNWLQAYDPEVYESDNIQRYMVALYWAYVP